MHDPETAGRSRHPGASARAGAIRCHAAPRAVGRRPAADGHHPGTLRVDETVACRDGIVLAIASEVARPYGPATTFTLEPGDHELALRVDGSEIAVWPRQRLEAGRIYALVAYGQPGAIVSRTIAVDLPVPDVVGTRFVAMNLSADGRPVNLAKALDTAAGGTRFVLIAAGIGYGVVWPADVTAPGHGGRPMLVTCNGAVGDETDGDGSHAGSYIDGDVVLMFAYRQRSVNGYDYIEVELNPTMQ